MHDKRNGNVTFETNLVAKEQAYMDAYRIIAPVESLLSHSSKSALNPISSFFGL